MAPPSKKRLNPRHKPSLNVKEIVLYGSPLWIGLPLVGWYFEGWLGAKSAIAGLLILAAYIASEVAIDRKSRRISGSKAVVLIAAGFGARLITLSAVTYVLYRFSALNLFVLLLTVAFGFTAMLFISAKNWLA